MDTTLYKITIAEQLQFKFLTDDEYKKFLQHLENTNWHYVKKQIYSTDFTDEVKQQLIVKVTDPTTLNFFKNNSIASQYDIYSRILNSWNIKYIKIQPPDDKWISINQKMTYLTQFNLYYKTEIDVQNSVMYKNIIEYLNIQRMQTNDILNVKNSILSVLDGNNKEFKYNPMLSDYSIDFTNRKVPIFKQTGYETRKIEYHNNIIINKFIDFLMNNQNWTNIIFDFIPRIAMSITHAKYIQINQSLKNMILTNEKLRKSICWKEFLKIYSYYEHVESSYKWTYFNPESRLLDFDFVQFITADDIPKAWGLDLTDTCLIQPTHTNISKLRTLKSALNKFHEITQDVFKSFIDNKYSDISPLETIKTIKKKNMTKSYFAGSIIQRICVEDSDLYDKYYQQSDIDVVVYPKKITLEEWTQKELIPFIPGKINITKKITNKETNTYKLWLFTDTGRKIEVFSSKKNILQLISRFHTDLVRSFTDGKNIFMYASALEAYLTKINNKLYWNHHIDPLNLHKIVAKHIERGYSVRIHKRDIESITKYLHTEKINYTLQQ